MFTLLQYYRHLNRSIHQFHLQSHEHYLASYHLVCGTFLGEPRVLEPVLILAVVIEQMLLSHLLQCRRRRWLIAAQCDPGGRRRRARRHAEVAVVGVEGRMRPVRLDAAALRRPVVGVPQAPVPPHVPLRRERPAARWLVLVHADRRAVDEESAKQ